MRVQIFPDALAHLRRGKIPMVGPVGYRDLHGIWLELLDPETLRVSHRQWETTPAEHRHVLHELEALLRDATLEYPPMPEPEPVSAERPARVSRRRPDLDRVIDGPMPPVFSE